MEPKPKRAFVFADDRSIRALVALDCKELTEREARIAGHVDLSSIKEGMVVRPADSEFKSDRTVAYIVANVEQKKGGDNVVKAVENISEIAKGNLSAVEQLSRSAKDMALQSEGLQEMVQAFRTE